MRHDRHFEIQPRKLAQMSSRVTILRAKHGSDLVDATEITRDRQLLVELRTLC